MTTNINTMLTVCDLYYNKKLTQSKISKLLKISRPTISRILDEAKEQGVVEIKIHAPLLTNSLLADYLNNKFKLKKIIILKNTDNYSFDLINLGKLIANFVNENITENNIMGISWGRAVENFVTNMCQVTWPNVKIIQINGSLGSEGIKMDGSELVIKLGEKTNSDYDLLTAPAFVNSEKLQLALLKQPQIHRVISQGKNYNLTVSGIGNLDTEHNTLYNAKIISNNDLKYLKEKGAVGHIAGRMYDISGNEIQITGKWPISPSLDIFKYVPLSIGCAIGKNRAQAVLGAINGGLINVLICDENLANVLIGLK